MACAVTFGQVLLSLFVQNAAFRPVQKGIGSGLIELLELSTRNFGDFYKENVPVGR